MKYIFLMKASHIWVAFVFTLPFVLSRPGTTVAPKENAACKSGKTSGTWKRASLGQDDCERYLTLTEPTPPIDVRIHPRYPSFVCCAQIVCKAPFDGSFCRNANKKEYHLSQIQGLGPQLSGYWVPGLSNRYCPAGSLCFVEGGNDYSSPAELPSEIDLEEKNKDNKDLSDKTSLGEQPNAFVAGIETNIGSVGQKTVSELNPDEVFGETDFQTDALHIGPSQANLQASGPGFSLLAPNTIAATVEGSSGLSTDSGDDITTPVDQISWQPTTADPFLGLLNLGSIVKE